MISSAITRTIWVLSLVSLFADVASEMLYPVMPVYLKSIGFSIVLIGILEGVAEAVAGLSKGYFGKLSDVSGKRVPFVRLGYLLSAVAKPLMVVFIQPVWVFGVRTLDRLGKGIRTGARDAILSDEAEPQSKGVVFGFHRSMDTYGAAAGPLIALLFLYFFPGQYLWLFLIAFFPGIISVLLTFFIQEPARITTRKKTVSFFYAVKYLRESPRQYNRIFAGLVFFSLINSSDIFLLLMVKHQGFSDLHLLSLYVFYNLVYAVFAYPLGKAADKIGLKKMFLLGILFFITTYVGFALSSSLSGFIFLFFIYGLFAAATDGVSRAWISNTCDKKDTGVAIGTLAGFQSIGALAASSLAGIIWYGVSPEATFGITAMGAGIVFLYFILVPQR